MQVAVYDHTGTGPEHRELFEGNPEHLEIYLRRAYPFLDREVINGDLNGCLEAIDEQQNFSVEVLSGEAELGAHEPFLQKYLREQDAEELEKGARGDWTREGYTIDHAQAEGTHPFVTVKARLGDKVVGQLDAGHSTAYPGHARAVMVTVHPQHRRRGLATAMYQRAEQALGMKFVPGTSQSKQARGLWNQEDRPFGKSEDLEKMAIKDIPPGPQTGSIWDGARTYHDYSHLLPAASRANGYTLELLDDKESGRTTGTAFQRSKTVGFIDGARSLGKVRVSQVEVHPGHRKRGLGTALYEALYAHSLHRHGVREAHGTFHSTTADATLRALARRHGLDYASERAAPSKPGGAYDNAFGPYDFALKSEGDDIISAGAEINLAKEMQGLLATQDSYFDTARWMAGAVEALSSIHLREALLKHDGDIELASLAAYGLGLTEENLRALRGLVGSGTLAKAEPEPLPTPQDITPAHPDATQASEEVRRAFEGGTVHLAKLNGKHSGGTMIGRDPESHHLYLLKPGSGDNSPAAGVHEEDASQSRREAAFWHTADFLGLSEYVPRADLLYIDGREVAAIRMLPLTFKNLGTALKQDPSLMPHCMRPYLYSGILHKWAVMDYVLGNPDRHSQNIMVDQDGRTLRLIDHGSALAGRSFDPAHDQNSFIPYYLRAWTGMKFGQLDDAQKLRQMPTAGIDGEKALARWLRDIDPKRLAAKLQSYGIEPEAMVERLEDLKMMPGFKDQAINRLWLGIGVERPQG